jgi:hypothetical protein
MLFFAAPILIDIGCAQRNPVQHCYLCLPVIACGDPGRSASRLARYG